MGVAWLGGTTVVVGLPRVDPVASVQPILGVGRLVARHWLVDDGLWGLPFGLVGSEGGGRRMHG